MVGAVLHRLDRSLDLRNRRDHQHFDEAVVLLDDAEHFEPADAREPDIQQHQIHVFPIEERERGFAGRCSEDSVFTLQNRRQRVTHPFIVVDDENGLGFVGHAWQA